MGVSKRAKKQELPEQPSAAQEQVYLRLRANLLRRFEGQFVAIYQGRVVGHGLNDEDLAQQMFEKFGDVPFFIQRVEKEPTVYDLPSPESVR